MAEMPEFDKVLITGSNQELNDYISESNKCLIVDWRDDEGSLTAQLGRMLPEGWFSGGWVSVGNDSDICVTYRGVQYFAGLLGDQPDRYVWLRWVNSVISADFELRVFRDTMGDDTHCFYLGSNDWWEAMETAFPRRMWKVFAPISMDSHFP